MKSRLVTRTVLATAAIGALLGSAQLMAQDCTPVKGKILNSYHDPALGNYESMGGVSTVGVVALNGGSTYGKLKCALAGVITSPPASQFSTPHFEHTISCDDSIDVGIGVVHSQLTFDTTGDYTGGDGVCTVSFTEHSVPRDGSGIGAFSGTTSAGSLLTIEGTVNSCTGSVDMTFTGTICK